ncbi:MAG: nucleotidyltransferase family protein [Rickettsiales bacterium]|nr:nucleotidyltransferase family protein [Rickettsiales bacterium]
MTLIDEIKANRENIFNIAKQYGVYDIRLVGSVARGEDDEKSDIDFLVNIESNRSLIDYMKFKNKIENIFNRKVDILCESALKDRFRSKIKNDIVFL